MFNLDKFADNNTFDYTQARKMFLDWKKALGALYKPI